MKFTHIFIARPILATVMSIIIVLVGALAYFNLPVAQYPEIAPPTIQVTASYPGASAEVVAETVATPLEQEINGVDGMIYMSSQSTADGRLTVTVTFELGTDLDAAQVLVQNRVAIAEPRLPEEVRRLGVTTRKNSPDLMMVVHLLSPDQTYDQLYISNYAFLQIRDVLSRVDGVGSITIFGAREYAMRVWLDPDRLAAFDLTAGDALRALRAQNVQVASGTLNSQPMENPGAFEYNVQTQGRLSAPETFGDIIVKAGEDGRLVRLSDIARIELGAQDYITNSYLDEDPAVAIVLFQQPGSNALSTAQNVLETMEGLAAEFPAGLEYQVVYNPTEFIEESVNEVYKTIFEAAALVVIVIFVFLQSLRASFIPVIAIPISLIGTFAVMGALGYSLNNLSLFGLVLAIGIVVDDAIIVVENIERNLREGLAPKDAARKSMDEVGGALIATSLVLLAVFVPTAFIPGISGQFYQQFAVTIAVATVISTFVSLTLSPALCSLLLRIKDENAKSPAWQRPLDIFFGAFNAGFDAFSSAYGRIIQVFVKVSAAVIVVYGGLLVLTGVVAQRTPTGFIPAQDQGYFIVALQLPPGASLARTDALTREAIGLVRETPGIERAVSFAGFNGATFTNATNAAVIFTPLNEFTERKAQGLTYFGILNDLRGRLSSITDAFVVVIPPPPVRGIGTGGGFKMMVQDRGGRGLDTLQQAAQSLSFAANGEEGLTQVFTFFETTTPQIFVDIDRTRAEMLDVPIENISETLEIYLGSAFVNDFNLLGRTYRVTAQADAQFRDSTEDIQKLRTRSNAGAMVPLGSVASFEDIAGPSRVPRYNLYPAAAVSGDTLPGISSGDALRKMEALADEMLPPGIGYEWTELAFQQQQQGNLGVLIFGLAVLFVFLVLAAQYESWMLPLSIILIVPLCILFALLGVNFRGMDNNILTQIGLVVLVALAAKNAILIVEFARQKEEEGLSRFDAAVEAAKLRLRPILMTAFAFILGVVPLLLAEGAGSEMRQALGTAVFFGMIGVTFIGLLLTPVFYVLCRWPADKFGKKETPEALEA